MRTTAATEIAVESLLSRGTKATILTRKSFRVPCRPCHSLNLKTRSRRT